MSAGPRRQQIDVAAPHVLREYAFLADGERGALLGPRGDIGWLCAPHWDSGSVFGTLIGGRGVYSITPRVPYVWGGYYESGTLIWRSRWATHDGIFECREALAYPAGPDRLVLLRRIEPIDCAARVAIVLCPRADYDATAVRRWRCADGVWTGRAGALRIRWTGAEKARASAGALTLDLDVEQGAHHDLVLEITAGDLPDRPPAADALWQETSDTWQAAVPELDCLRAAHDARHHYAVVRGLTSASGTVAAATTSLPERAGDDRNYDYRYVWLRDQCFVGQAAARCGGVPLLDISVETVAAHLLDDGERLSPAYTVRGDPVPKQRHLDLPGYPGGSDVVGNRVRDQFQLDVFGEALLLFAAAARTDRMSSRGWDAVTAAVAAIDRCWRKPDAGIWEIENRHWTHSKLIAAAGLRAIAAAAPKAISAAAGDWVASADRIVAATAKSALHKRGFWQRAADEPAMDAALLFAGLRGAVPPGDPRTTATLAEFLRRLTVDGYAYRFRHDDRPLYEAEGSFLLCGFTTALALHEQGCRTDAVAWFERTRAACGPPQLFSEEYDTQQHQLRGNLPQAFVHAVLIECAATLGEGE